MGFVTLSKGEKRKFNYGAMLELGRLQRAVRGWELVDNKYATSAANLNSMQQYARMARDDIDHFNRSRLRNIRVILQNAERIGNSQRGLDKSKYRKLKMLKNC